ncbi:hypothetical protein FN846DRAFT_784699, partial [Sphaerosporella brunnea]
QENDELDEEALVRQLRPLIEQATGTLKETEGRDQSARPDGRVSQSATRKAQDHEGTKEEQHLAELLAQLTGEVTKAIENARDKIKNMPSAKKTLGPLLDLFADPLFQIVSGVGLLLNGVLSLLGNIVSTPPPP